MKKPAIIAIAIIVVAIIAVFFITNERKDANILAALDKTNYNATKPANTGLSSLASLAALFI